MPPAPVVMLGLDQGPSLTGWCVGDGGSVPACGAWRYDDLPGAVIGPLGRRYRDDVDRLICANGVTHVVFESPLVDRYRDKVVFLRRRFGMDMLLEALCADHGVVCEEAPFGDLKRTLGGSPKATKDDMVHAALKCGLALPKTLADGREDAADAFAAWLIALRHYAKQHQPTWDRRLYSPRGALI